MYYKLYGGDTMKIVVIKSPRILSGILRMVFRIKKQEGEQ